MKSLIITAHPSSKGHTHAIASSYGESLTRRGWEYEIIDLYAPENVLPQYAFEDLRSVPDNENRRRFQGKIMEANELVFIHPIWWSNMPGVMKNFLDHTLSAGFAFKYVNAKPVGLLTGKTARVFVTCGGPAWIYTLTFNSLKRIWGTFTLGFCGVKMVSYMTLDKMAPLNEERVAKFLEKVKNI
jgi:putative NADPH-quinone reductase